MVELIKEKSNKKQKNDILYEDPILKKVKNIIERIVIFVILCYIFIVTNLFKDLKYNKESNKLFYNFFIFNFFFNFFSSFYLFFIKKNQNYIYMLIGINIIFSILNLFIAGFPIYRYMMILICIGYLMLFLMIFNFIKIKNEPLKIIIINILFLIYLNKELLNFN